MCGAVATMGKAKKDFAKQKLKVGKGKLQPVNATNTSFTSKKLNVPTQSLGNKQNLHTNLNLVKHHQAAVRKQAITYIHEHHHLHPSNISTIINAVVGLIVDSDHQVRQAVLKLLSEIEPATLSTFAPTILLFVHSAMTHITPAIRAEATLYLDVLLNKAPDQTIRQGFVRTLELFMTLLGFTAANKSSTAGAMATTSLSFGKNATKTKLTHLKSLQSLLALGLANDSLPPDNLFHPDTFAFMIPTIAQPYTYGDRVVTEDSEARMTIVDELRPVLESGLSLSVKEGGDAGRIAARVLSTLTV